MPVKRALKRKASALQQPDDRIPRRPRQSPPSITKLDPTRFGLGDLPGELRNLVYRYALVHHDAVNITHDTSKANRELALSLMAVCKAVHREALPIFYTENTFRRTYVKGVYWHEELDPYGRHDHEANKELNTLPLDHFIQCIGGKNLSMISKMEFATYQLSYNPRYASQVGSLGKPCHVVQITIAPRSPYIIASLGETKDRLRSGAELQESSDYLQAHVKSMQIRGVRKLAKQEVEELEHASLACVLWC